MTVCFLAEVVVEGSDLTVVVVGASVFFSLVVVEEEVEADVVVEKNSFLAVVFLSVVVIVAGEEERKPVRMMFLVVVAKRLGLKDGSGVVGVVTAPLWVVDEVAALNRSSLSLMRLRRSSSTPATFSVVVLGRGAGRPRFLSCEGEEDGGLSACSV